MADHHFTQGTPPCLHTTDAAAFPAAGSSPSSARSGRYGRSDRATHLSLVEERKMSGLTYMDGYRVGKREVRREARASRDRYIGLGFVYGLSIGAVLMIVGLTWWPL